MCDPHLVELHVLPSSTSLVPRSSRQTDCTLICQLYSLEKIIFCACTNESCFCVGTSPTITLMTEFRRCFTVKIRIKHFKNQSSVRFRRLNTSSWQENSNLFCLPLKLPKSFTKYYAREWGSIMHCWCTICESKTLIFFKFHIPPCFILDQPEFNVATLDVLRLVRQVSISHKILDN